MGCFLFLPHRRYPPCCHLRNCSASQYNQHLYHRSSISRRTRGAFDQAIAINPKDALSFHARGRSLLENKLPQQALDSFDKAIDIKPQFAQAHNERGLALQQMKQFDQALISFSAAVALDPHLAQAHFNRGRALKESQQFSDALHSFEQAIAITPSNAQAHIEQGGTLMASYKAMLAQPEDWLAKRQADGLPRYGRPMQLALQPFMPANASQKVLCCTTAARFD